MFYVTRNQSQICLDRRN